MNQKIHPHQNYKDNTKILTFSTLPAINSQLVTLFILALYSASLIHCGIMSIPTERRTSSAARILIVPTKKY